MKTFKMLQYAFLDLHLASVLCLCFVDIKNT